MQQPGQIVGGRYRIGKLIGAGGMGAVYEARHLLTDHAVAIKLLNEPSNGLARPSPLEAKIDARVGSAHIVHVYDAGVDERLGVPFIVMELLRGATLERLVKRRPEGRLAAAEALHLLGQLALGLDAAHSYSVVHCDLKPDNIFVTAASTVKILDFGIAKILAAADPVTRDQRGTPFYMAPEQARGEPVSAQTDIWALGLVAYRVLTGRDYWRSAQRSPAVLAEVVYEMTVAPQQPPSARLAEQGVQVELPAAFDAWFLRCIERDPEARFPTARAAMSALASAFEPLACRATLAAGSEPISERAPSTQPTRTYDRSPRTGTGLGRVPAGVRGREVAANARHRWAAISSFAVWGALVVAYWQHESASRALDVAALAPVAARTPAVPEPVALAQAVLEPAAVDAAALDAAALDAAVLEPAVLPVQPSASRSTPLCADAESRPASSKPSPRQPPSRVEQVEQVEVDVEQVAVAVRPQAAWPEDLLASDNVDPWNP